MPEGFWSTVGFAAIILVPIGLVLWWMRKPASNVPRDAMASRAKASARGLGLLIWPTKAYHETLIDDAIDTAPSCDDDVDKRTE